MNTLKRFLQLAAVSLGFLCLPGCDSTGVDYNNMPGRAGVGIGGSDYYGTGYYDPWYYGAGYYPPAVVVVPPHASMPPPHVSPR